MTPVVLPPLKWKESPNQSTRGRTKISLVVVHDTEGGYQGAVSWFANSHSEVSAHIVLKEDGSEATQMVSYAQKAWHAASFNSCSIGLEMAGFAKKGYGEHEWAVAARIVAFLLHKHGLPGRWAKGGGGAGFCRHYDLGKAGGGHYDPTTDDGVWARFVHQVQDELARGGFPGQLGQMSSIPINQGGTDAVRRHQVLWRNMTAVPPLRQPTISPMSVAIITFLGTAVIALVIALAGATKTNSYDRDSAFIKASIADNTQNIKDLTLLVNQMTSQQAVLQQELAALQPVKK